MDHNGNLFLGFTKALRYTNDSIMDTKCITILDALHDFGHENVTCWLPALDPLDPASQPARLAQPRCYSCLGLLPIS
jgi:hypothetical protein